MSSEFNIYKYFSEFFNKELSKKFMQYHVLMCAFWETLEYLNYFNNHLEENALLSLQQKYKKGNVIVYELTISVKGLAISFYV